MGDLLFAKALVNINTGVTDLDSDTIKVALLTGAPTESWEDYVDITNELAAGNGYTTGGVAVTLAVTETGAVTTVDSSDPVWDPITCTTPSYAVWYSETSGKLICSKDLGGAQIVTNNELRLTVSASGLFDYTHNNG